MDDKRAEALRIFRAGLSAADPVAAVQRHLHQVTQTPALIIAVGKAARQMAVPVLHTYPRARCLVVTNYENAQPLDGAQVFPAGHPVPDENGEKAARAVIAALKTAKGPVLALISGGGSALLPAPAGDISLSDKQAVNALLLGSGLAIEQMNLVRQQLSELKGGGMLQMAAPWPVTSLILSDVVGDDLSVIASGPTAAPIGTAAQAVELLRSNGLWDQLPHSVQAHLTAPQTDTAMPVARNILVGSNSQSLAAMAAAAPSAHAIAAPVIGDVQDAARNICDGCGRGITVWGGETTVVLRGTGRGGRNQELALRIAQEATARGWVNWLCLQAGSDGRDGPTDAAGGIVDSHTLDRIKNLQASLCNNDSYTALEQARALLITGPTGTNVADLGIMIRD